MAVVTMRHSDVDKAQNWENAIRNYYTRAAIDLTIPDESISGNKLCTDTPTILGITALQTQLTALQNQVNALQVDKIGDIVFSADTSRDNSLLCDGSAINRITYSDLFSVIGVIFGIGDGSTTFNLPDLRGRTPIGSGQGAGLTNRTLADSDGEENHQLTTDELPSHTHTESGQTGTSSELVALGLVDIPVLSSQNTGSTGNDQEHNNMQPFLVLNAFIVYEV